MYLVEDQYQRTFKTLRISLTNACNFGCVYCVQGEEVRKDLSATNTALTVDQLLRTVSELKTLLPLETIRLTGGEPTLFKELVPLMEGLSKMGISSIKMTSNGYLLADMASRLAAAGLKEVNISLDAIDVDVFYKVSRRKDLHRVLNAIEQCMRHGIQVKLNTVIMKGLNDSQILPLLYYAGERNIAVRFLELMKMGYYYSHEFERYFYSENKILNTISEDFIYTQQERIAGATSNYWMTQEGYRFGIIANESSPFCGDCDRLRLDSNGNVFGCLSENTAVPVYGILHDKDELIERLKLALSHKQAVQFKGSKLEMIAIGG
ncbi:MAG: cyclohydrolase subunit MoaA [Cytophagaceae bacterium]|jgi:cyclic pyranopterin phosphate synthase|nr:cyclohydrolase subunit MoaA [Cytophagaceae bacterium]